MAYIKHKAEIGQTVITTEIHKSMAGMFEIGTIVTITDIDSTRGYEITDKEGNSVCEIGWTI